MPLFSLINLGTEFLKSQIQSETNLLGKCSVPWSSIPGLLRRRTFGIRLIEYGIPFNKLGLLDCKGLMMPMFLWHSKGLNEKKNIISEYNIIIYTAVCVNFNFLLYPPKYVVYELWLCGKCFCHIFFGFYNWVGIEFWVFLWRSGFSLLRPGCLTRYSFMTMTINVSTF